MWTAILVVHGVLVASMVPFFVLQAHCLVLYLSGYRRWLIRFREDIASSAATSTEPAPFVTVQLPVYNELEIVDRLIEAAAALDHPHDRFEVQVLDDSTDETTGMIERKVAEVRARNPRLRIAHLRRGDRAGFKAGNLRSGLASAQGDFFVLFDADFIPAPDFLSRTLPGFRDPKVGIIQTRWAHLNETDSSLTRTIAMMMDADFSIEQGGKWVGGLVSNFSGTAALIRRTALDEAGGWQDDTLTEDIDLSVRTQLKGWKILFLEDVATPAELPANMTAFRIQQFRWTKGFAGVCRKLLPAVVRSSMPSWKKLHAGIWLLASVVWPAITVANLLSVPELYAKASEPGIAALLQGWMAILVLLTPLQLAFFGTSRRGKTPMNPLRFVWQLTYLNLVIAGLSLNNAIASAEGWLGKRSPFVRTPRLGSGGGTGSRSRAIGWLPVLEALLALYFLGGFLLGIRLGDYSLLGLHLMFSGGFGLVSFLSIRDAFVREPASRAEPAAGAIAPDRSVVPPALPAVQDSLSEPVALS